MSDAAADLRAVRGRRDGEQPAVRGDGGTGRLAADAPILQVRDLKKYFPITGGWFGRTAGHVRAVDGVSFDVNGGETFGLVGESGCGKTTTGRMLLRLEEPTSGQIVFDGTDLSRLGPARLRKMRRNLQMIFQDPYASLDPRMTAAEIVAEPLAVHGMPKAGRARRVAELLSTVGLDAAAGHRYPHEFSGGQRQRIGIARALALNPRLIVCDEPVSALDVSIQSQVVNLLMDLQRAFDLTYIFIAHDLSVVRHISDRVGVMYLGRLVELADATRVYGQPAHPYTQALLSAIPVPDPAAKRQRIILQGDVPSPADPPSGCRFRTRCPLAQARCEGEEPIWREVAPAHWVACHFAQPSTNGGGGTV